MTVFAPNVGQRDTFQRLLHADHTLARPLSLTLPQVAVETDHPFCTGEPQGLRYREPMMTYEPEIVGPMSPRRCGLILRQPLVLPSGTGPICVLRLLCGRISRLFKPLCLGPLLHSCVSIPEELLDLEAIEFPQCSPGFLGWESKPGPYCVSYWTVAALRH